MNVVIADEGQRQQPSYDVAGAGGEAGYTNANVAQEYDVVSCSGVNLVVYIGA
jgi:hypothetical protein